MLFSCYLQIFHSFIGPLRCFVANLLVLICLGLFFISVLFESRFPSLVLISHLNSCSNFQWWLISHLNSCSNFQLLLISHLNSCSNFQWLHCPAWWSFLSSSFYMSTINNKWETRNFQWWPESQKEDPSIPPSGGNPPVGGTRLARTVLESERCVIEDQSFASWTRHLHLIFDLDDKTIFYLQICSLEHFLRAHKLLRVPRNWWRS